MNTRQSTFRTAKTCWKKAFNRHHRKLEAPRSQSLTDGTAFHTGAALLRAGKGLETATAAALVKFEEEVATMPILPEQSYLLDDNRDLVKQMLKLFNEGWFDARVEVIQPECHFAVPLPHSGHNCIWKHAMSRFSKTEGPLEFFAPESILAGDICSPHPTPDPGCDCWSDHIVEGTTDTIFRWGPGIWLEDHKTTALNPGQFWEQWPLDFQLTIYMWAVKQTLGFTPNGFVINGIFRPSQKQVSNWNSKRKSGPDKTELDYLKYEREAFLRTEEDLDRAAVVLKEFCDEWEWRITKGYFGGTFGGMACTAYNRKCDYWEMCTTHDKDQQGLVKIEETK